MAPLTPPAGATPKSAARRALASVAIAAALAGPLAGAVMAADDPDRFERAASLVLASRPYLLGGGACVAALPFLAGTSSARGLVRPILGLIRGL